MAEIEKIKKRKKNEENEENGGMRMTKSEKDKKIIHDSLKEPVEAKESSGAGKADGAPEIEAKACQASGGEMRGIEKVQQAACEFLKKTLNEKDAKVILAAKTGAGWEVDVEIYEESSFIKALGLNTKVQDRNIYTVKMNETLEVVFYGKKGETVSSE